MKPKWLATLNAGKYKAVLQSVKSLSTVFLLSLVLLIISCDKSDDLETIDNESPIDDESVVVYSDIEPDFTSKNHNDSYNLDLNNDQIIDFTVSSFNEDGWKWFGIASNPIAENGIMSVEPWYSHAVPLNRGKEIFNLRGYRNGEFYKTWGILTVGNCMGGDPDCSYNWKDKVDKYLGLRFIIKGKTHYGWARLEVASVTQWIIKDYAYNATPNKPILAGQKK